MKIKNDHWLEIAEAYGTPDDLRTGRQREIAYLGLCHAIHKTTGMNGTVVHNFMASFFTKMEGYGAIVWPFFDPNDHDASNNGRCLFALLMWAIGEKEFARLVK